MGMLIDLALSVPVQGQDDVLLDHDAEYRRQRVIELQRTFNPKETAGPAAEARRQRVLEMLAQRPGTRYAAVTGNEAEPDAVILALAIRGVGTFELHIPKAKYDGVLLLDLIERHSGTIH